MPEHWETFANNLVNIFKQNEGMRDAHLMLLGSPLSSMRSNWVYIYSYATKRGLFNPIDKLPEDEKKELWNHAKEIGKELNKEQLIDLCKSLITIEYYL
jgi:hypothetical protein